MPVANEREACALGGAHWRAGRDASPRSCGWGWLQSLGLLVASPGEKTDPLNAISSSARDLHPGSFRHMIEGQTTQKEEGHRQNVLDLLRRMTPVPPFLVSCRCRDA